jgi:class 3 adenylate cyclase
MARNPVAELAWIGRIGLLPSDPDEERLRKSTLTLFAVLISAAGFTWAAMYALLGLTLPAAFPLAYSVLSLLALLHFGITKRYRVFQFNQLALIMAVPIVLQWSLGGFVRSGAVMLWSLMAPLGALMFQGRGAAVSWFLGYVALATISGLLEARLAVLAPPVAPGVVVLFFVLNISGVSGVIFLLMRYFVAGQAEAQMRSDRLLLNILPRPIAERLKRDASAIAEAYAEVTVLFADIVDFTRLSAGITPRQLVDLLNDVFSEFDRLAEQHGLEKIKTIGDAYMVVGGLPALRPDHAEAVAEMALEMQRALEGCAMRAGTPLALRIGIHSGPVVAGVIGKKKFIYDLWGDTVNTASRMESHGLPDAIQVSEATYERLRDRYLFRERGVIPIKSKGEMTTYLMLGRKDAAVAAAVPSPP